MDKIPTGYLIYFLFLGLLTIGSGAIAFLVVLESYYGYAIGNGGGIILLPAVFALLVNVISTIVMLIKRKYRPASLIFLSISILSLFWDTLATAIYPHDKHKIEQLITMISTDEFGELQRLYSETYDSIYVSIFPVKNYIMVGEYVFNIKKRTFGKHTDGLGFFGEYYESGRKTKYTDEDSLLHSLSLNISSADLHRTYALLQQLEVMDIYYDSLIHAASYRFDASAGAGNRGIIMSPNVDRTALEQQYGRITLLEKIAPNIYYFSAPPNSN